MKKVVAVLVGAFTLTTALSSTQASAPLADVSSPAAANALAQSLSTPTDVVRVAQTSVLSLDVYARATSAAAEARGTWAASRGASVPMDRVMRGAEVVQQPEIAGYHFPMNVTALPTEAIAPLMGRNVAAVIARGELVMGATTAGLRDAQVGDTVDLIAASGVTITFAIGMLADASVIGSSELLMSSSQADQLGVTNVTSILMWGFSSRDDINDALAMAGLEPRAGTRIRRSWDPFDPDSPLSMTETKVFMGEFAYRVRPNGTDADVTPTWSGTHIPSIREVYPTGIRARCNFVIIADLQAALDEVINTGLENQIDVANANRYGGCYYPRFARLTGNLGFLSRHAWGSPLDTNTTTNAQGAVPQMNCDVVRIFRKHNFVWGGNFLTPDGMHFEWVGERRDLYQYPSTYCPNLPVWASADSTSGGQSGNRTTGATIFQDDGWGTDE